MIHVTNLRCSFRLQKTTFTLRAVGFEVDKVAFGQVVRYVKKSHFFSFVTLFSSTTSPPSPPPSFSPSPSPSSSSPPPPSSSSFSSSSYKALQSV